MASPNAGLYDEEEPATGTLEWGMEEHQEDQE